MKSPLVCAFAFVLLAVPVVAQDTPSQEKNEKKEKETTLDSLPDDAAASDAEARKTEDQKADDEKNAELLSEALRGLRRTQDVVVRAVIEHKESEQAVGPLGGMPIQIRRQMAGVFGRGLTPFTGKVEAWAAADGVTVLLSESDVPGFAIYTRGDRTVTRRTTDDGEDLPLENVTKELAPLLDVMRLTRHIASADLKAATDPASGDVTFTGELARELVRPLGDGGGFQRVRTLRVDGTLVVTPEGRFKRIAVKVTHNDPVAESQRGRTVRIVVQGGGGPGGGQILPVENDDGEEKHDLEGGKTTYTLTFGEGEPSARAKDFRREIEALLEKR
jgi:hypothetical protein